MTDSEETLILGAYWDNRKMSVREIARFAFEVLQRLRAISPLLDHWRTMVEGDAQQTELPADLAEFERVIFRFLEDPGDFYENPDPTDHRFTLDSTLAIGLGFPCWTAEETGAAISVTFHAGAYSRYNPTSYVLLEVSPLHHTLLSEPHTARQLVLALVELCQPTFTTAYSHELLEHFAIDYKLDQFGLWMHVAGPVVPHVTSPLVNVEHGVLGGTLLHMDVPYPWSAHAEELRPAFEACRDAGVLDWFRKTKASE